LDEAEQELSLNLKQFSAVYILMCLECSVQLLIKNYGSTEDKKAPNNGEALLKGFAVLGGGIIATTVHSGVWLYRIKKGMRNDGANCL
jgi:hypothetical protein